MQRLVAGLAIVAFLAACSDSSTTAPRQLHPGTALSAGDPPPPPLSGGGRGFVDAGSDFASTASATNTAPASSCTLSHNFGLINYTFTYFINKNATNEMAHLDLTGTPGGQITIHDLGNGKSNATGKVQDEDYVFEITDGEGSIDAVVAEGTVDGTFSYPTVSGMLTELSSGQKCSVTGSLTGRFTQVIVPD